MPNIKFTYDDFRGTHVITMQRAAPEWCNSDCPTLYSISGDPALDNLRINSDGLLIESIPDELARLFARFVRRSSEAFYRKMRAKYPNSTWVNRENGFWSNFVRMNTRYYGAEYMRSIGVSCAGNNGFH